VLTQNHARHSQKTLVFSSRSKPDHKVLVQASTNLQSVECAPFSRAASNLSGPHDSVAHDFWLGSETRSQTTYREVLALVERSGFSGEYLVQLFDSNRESNNPDPRWLLTLIIVRPLLSLLAKGTYAATLQYPSFLYLYPFPAKPSSKDKKPSMLDIQQRKYYDTSISGDSDSDTGSQNSEEVYSSTSMLNPPEHAELAAFYHLQRTIEMLALLKYCWSNQQHQ
jgi:hypothetical protein